MGDAEGVEAVGEGAGGGPGEGRGGGGCCFKLAQMCLREQTSRVTESMENPSKKNRDKGNDKGMIRERR